MFLCYGKWNFLPFTISRQISVSWLNVALLCQFLLSKLFVVFIYAICDFFLWDYGYLFWCNSLRRLHPLTNKWSCVSNHFKLGYELILYVEFGYLELIEANLYERVVLRKLSLLGVVRTLDFGASLRKSCNCGSSLQLCCRQRRTWSSRIKNSHLVIIHTVMFKTFLSLLKNIFTHKFINNQTRVDLTKLIGENSNV